MIPPGYIVHDDGTIIGKRYKRPLKPARGTAGYLQVGLYVDGKTRSYQVHTLVCEAFYGPKPFPEAEVRHLDGNQLNNRASNLKWGTAAENRADQVRLGTAAVGSRNGNSRFTEADILDIRDKHSKGTTQVALAREYGVNVGNINIIVRRQAWRHI